MSPLPPTPAGHEQRRRARRRPSARHDHAGGDDVAGKFEAAWSVFGRTCHPFTAPEASFQAWFAHYLISQFGIDRVAREPVIKHQHFASHWRALVPGGPVRLDNVVTPVPVANSSALGGGVTPFRAGSPFANLPRIASGVAQRPDSRPAMCPADVVTKRRALLVGVKKRLFLSSRLPCDPVSLRAIQCVRTALSR